MSNSPKASITADSDNTLIAILKDRHDFAILTQEHWYRIPVDRTPRRWPPQWLAFYLPKAFGEQAYAVRYYGRVKQIEAVPRRVLLPDQLGHPNADMLYHRVELEELVELPNSIPSQRFRRIVFIPTTFHKLMNAEEINDLFDDSPLEDRLWQELRVRQIPAERQWAEKVQDRRYYLDFALFCNEGKIDIETDGDTWHAQRRRIRSDNVRNNDLEAARWHVLRFNGQEVRETAGTYCISRITELINRLGGLTEATLVPRRFYESADSSVQQLAMLEDEQAYQVE